MSKNGANAAVFKQTPDIMKNLIANLSTSGKSPAQTQLAVQAIHHILQAVDESMDDSEALCADTAMPLDTLQIIQRELAR